MTGPRGLNGALGGDASVPLDAERIDGRRVARAFGATLRALRREREVSQEALAFDAEIDRTYPSLLERGLRHPTLSVLLRLSRALAGESCAM
jgi:DNA-binding XRE family transcriptional regulator